MWVIPVGVGLGTLLGGIGNLMCGRSFFGW